MESRVGGALCEFCEREMSVTAVRYLVPVLLVPAASLSRLQRKMAVPPS